MSLETIDTKQDAKKTYLLGILLALSSFAVLSFGDAFVKKATFSYEIVTVAFWTNIFTTLSIFIICIFCGGPKKLYETYSLKLQLLRGLIFLCVFLTFLYAISNMPIVQTYTFLLVQPFILCAMAHFILKETIGVHRILAIIFGFVGVLVVLRPGFIELSPTPFVALLCAFLFASQNIVVKFMDTRDHWLTYAFYVMAVQTPIFAIILFVMHGTIPVPNIQNIPWVAVAGTAYALGLMLIPLALRKIDASLFGATEFTALIWGSIFGYFMFSEIPDNWTIIGAAIIVASGLYLVYRERQAHNNM